MDNREKKTVVSLLARNRGEYNTMIPLGIVIDGRPLGITLKKKGKWNHLVYALYDYCIEKTGCDLSNDTRHRYEMYKKSKGTSGAEKAGEVLEKLVQECFSHEKRIELIICDSLYWQNHKHEETVLNTGNFGNDVLHMDSPSTKNYLNTILYGPPGTGKTYTTFRRAVEIIDGPLDGKAEEEIRDRYKELASKGQIEFVTFHQSYCYEDFVEGIRPAIADEDEDGAKYECRPGVFRNMCERASTYKRRTALYDFDTKKINFNKMSLGNTLTQDQSVYEYCIENNVISLGWGGDVDYSDCSSEEEIREAFTQEKVQQSKFAVQAIKRFKDWMKKDDIVVISYGNLQARAIARVTGEYRYDPEAPIRHKHFRAVQWLYKDVSIPVSQILKGKQFSQQSIYQASWEDVNVEGLRSLLSKDGDQSERPNYVLIIDEINRGNISKIFGELISLLEQDKRSGAPNELQATLPYSQESLVVPDNLYLLGTMNTADKSIALVDVALRRRFAFKELMPNFSKCSNLTDEMREVLSELNNRIHLRKDRDHQIGHSYFIDVTDEESFNVVFKDKILPLLQEYFWNDWEGLRFVLGEDGADNGSFVERIPNSGNRSARNKWQLFSDGGKQSLKFLEQLKLNYQSNKNTDV